VNGIELGIVALALQDEQGLLLDAMKIGGVTGWLCAASLAKIYGVPVSSHLARSQRAITLCDPDRTLARIRRLVEHNPDQPASDRERYGNSPKCGGQRRGME
jgi:hypothetical protein